MFRGVSLYWSRRLLRRLIIAAVQALYSEQGDFEDVVPCLSPGPSDLDLLRTYMAIQTAGRLSESLSKADVENALTRFLASAVCAETTQFPDLLDAHKWLATWCWMGRQKHILEGKLAAKEDEYGLRGAVYRAEHAGKGPLSRSERTRIEALCGEMARLSEEIEQRELAALKNIDGADYHKQLQESASRTVERELEGIDRRRSNADLAEWMSEAEQKIDRLLAEAARPQTKHPDAPVRIPTPAMDEGLIPAITWPEAVAILNVIIEALQETDHRHHPVSALKGYDIHEIFVACRLHVANEVLLLDGAPDFETRFAEGIKFFGGGPWAVMNTFVADELVDVLGAPHYFEPFEPTNTTIRFKTSNAVAEKMETFGEYCRSLGSTNSDYWRKVYAHIGVRYTLACPHNNEIMDPSG